MFPTSASVFLARTSARVLAVLAVSLAALTPAHAEQPVDPNAAPNDFMQVVANNMLDAIKADDAARDGDVAHVEALIHKYALPYIDMRKTTQLSAGRYWRQATPDQKNRLVDAFTDTLIRTYSGAFSRVGSDSQINILPFRGDPKADDAVVRSTVSQNNGPSVGVDYRLERTDAGWKIYDLNVEGIWLIQNYRNQFSSEINRNGIDGLIKALEAKNK
ncbi:MAG: ABC transporter substrate-binding protein [Alcaligenaceae bacterium]|nr:ABC transporter substrate-binding protein [Alcaligenaceae bacterium]